MYTSEAWRGPLDALSRAEAAVPDLVLRSNGALKQSAKRSSSRTRCFAQRLSATAYASRLSCPLLYRSAFIYEVKLSLRETQKSSVAEPGPAVLTPPKRPQSLEYLVARFTRLYG